MSQTIQSEFASQQGFTKKYKQWRLYTVCVYTPLILLFGVPVSVVAIVINRKKLYEYTLSEHLANIRTQASMLLVVGFWSIALGFLAINAPSPTPALYTLALLWVFVIPAAPVIAWVFRYVDRFLRAFKPITLDEQVRHMQAQQERRIERESTQAGKIADTGQPVKGFLDMGAFIKGDMFSPRLGVHTKRNHVYIEDRLIREHMIIVGTTGAGKTETLKNLIKQILWSSDRDIFVVDGKGDADFALDIANLIYGVRGKPVPIFKLGQTTSGAVYHGFRGHPQDIYNRLCALVGVDEATTGEGAYYADINRDLLQLVCYAPAGAPQSFEQVRERLNKSWLLSAYKGTEEEKTITELDPKILNGLLVRVRPLVREFAPIVDPTGFILEESRGAIFSLRTQSVGDSARRFLKFLVEDFKDFVGKRQRPGQPAVFIIDEFGAFGNNNITALLSLARSSDLGVVLATQDAVTLGDESTKRKILANTRTKMLMVTEYPEELAKLAGTIYAIEASIQHAEGDPTGVGSARIQHQFKIDMNEAAKLEPGEAFLIRQRTALKLKGPRIGRVEYQRGAVANFPKPVTIYQQPTIAEQDTPPAL